MQIQLRQTEIIAALKQYIVMQGISLAGKAVEISFTAGRKESGISADISIDEGTQAQLPGLDADEDDAAGKPCLNLVQATPATASIALEAVPEDVPPQADAQTEAPKPAAASLFN